MDVDGTLTDGKIYMGAEGEVFKAFDIKDGYALHTLVKENGIIPVIITARKSPMVLHRCKELGVTEIHQGVMNKLDCLKDVLKEYSSAGQQYDLSNVAYIGDDLLDLKCMNPIKAAGGLAACPADAVPLVVHSCDYVSTIKAGEGAVRDFVEYVIDRNRKNKSEDRELIEKIYKAIDFISKLDFANLEVGRYQLNDSFYYSVQEYNAFGDNEAQYESHRYNIDIQWVYDGEEKLLITDVGSLIPSGNYDKEKDVIHYHDSGNMSAIILRPGSCAVLFPKDAHKPSMFMNNRCVVKKVVGKLKIL